MKKIPIRDQLNSTESLMQKLALRKAVLLGQANNSTNVGDILKAEEIMGNFEKRQPVDSKSFLIDPLHFQQSFGYKNRNFNLSYEMLKRMSHSSIIAAIHTTRINQVASFAEPQRNKYTTGFKIQLKNVLGADPKKPTKQDEKKIEEITNFILNCGKGNVWDNDDFDTFVRKYVRDSMAYDQGTFEVREDRRGQPFDFVATDASTFRIADSYVDDEYEGAPKQKVHGYLPSYVQLESGLVKAEFYPWELCFGVRNPTTSIYNVGYGQSEQEILVNQVTSMLWSEEYNRKFFSQGSMPKGFIRVDGQIGAPALQKFRQEWQGMMSGMVGAHKTPILEAGKIDWVDLHKSNNDMEFSNWYEFLIKVTCAIYTIDPAEINFPLSGGAEQKAMFEGNNEARIKHSKDKGLYPILKHLQARINKFIVNRIDPRFEFIFAGMDAVSESEELEMDVKKATNLETLNEVRERRGLKPIEGGDIVLNSAFLQKQQQDAQAKQQEMMMQQGGGDEEQGDEQEWDENETDPDEADTQDNPFAKAFNDYFNKSLLA